MPILYPLSFILYPLSWKMPEWRDTLQTISGLDAKHLPLMSEQCSFVFSFANATHDRRGIAAKRGGAAIPRPCRCDCWPSLSCCSAYLFQMLHWHPHIAEIRPGKNPH